MYNAEYTTSPGSPFCNGFPDGSQNLSGLTDQEEAIEQVEFLLGNVLHLENKHTDGDSICFDFGEWEETHIQLEIDKEGLIQVTHQAEIYSFVIGEWMEPDAFEDKFREVFFPKIKNQAA